VTVGNSSLWRGTSATDVTSATSNNQDFTAAPLVLNGNVYFASQNNAGTTTHLTYHPFSGNTLGAAVTSNINGGVPYFGLVTDGTTLYGATHPASGAGSILAIIPAFVAGTTATWSTALTQALAGEPTFGIDGKLYGADLGNAVSTFDPATGTKAAFVTLTGGAGLTPLQGSDGHIYFSRKPSSLLAYDGNLLSWTFNAPTTSTILRYATMDCSGRVFVGAGSTVYAFLSDDKGLADTAWPTLRRDGRNTGNASPPYSTQKYGIRTVTGCTQ